MFLINKNVGIAFIFLVLFSLVFSCKNKQDAEPVHRRQEVKRAVVKKDIKKQNPLKLLRTTEIDREKTPYAGVWEPNGETGFLLIFPDGKFELYGKYDKSCKKAPKVKGNYKVISDKTLEVMIDGKTKTIKLKVMSNFVKIGDLGIFWPPTGLTLKEDQKEFTDPKKLIKFCRNVNKGSVSKIYTYLTDKSKLELLKIGITNKNDFAAHYKFTDSIGNFLDEYKKIVSINSIKKNANDETFKVILKNMEGKTFGENFTVSKEGEHLRCGFFNDFKLVSSKEDAKEVSFWYKEMASKSKTYKFNSKENKSYLEILFDAKNISIKKFKSDKTISEELNGEFKIIVNTPNVVAISLKEKKNNEENTEKTDEKIGKKKIIVFKSGTDELITVIINDDVYIMKGNK